MKDCFYRRSKMVKCDEQDEYEGMQNGKKQQIKRMEIPFLQNVNPRR